MRQMNSCSSMLRYWIATGCLALCVGHVIPPGTTSAQDQAESVDPGRAMRLVESANWYDSGRGGYRPPSVDDEKDNPLRRDGWLAEEKGKSAGGSQWSPNAGQAWNFGFGRFGGDWISALILLVLGGMLAAVIILLLFHSYRSYLPNRYQARERSKRLEIDPAKIVDLPFEAETSTSADPLERAYQCLQAGEFRRAVVLLYAYQLLALDQRRKIDLQRGKTNRMYLRELRSASAPLEALVKRTMLVFEEVFFGDRETTREQVNSLWNDLDAFHHELEIGQAESVTVGKREALPT